MNRHLPLVLGSFCTVWALGTGAGAAGAADLVEPWAPGFTNFELHVAGERPAAGSLASVVGIGVGGGLSLGVGAAVGDDLSETGLVLLYARGLDRFGELDLWAEAVRSAGGGAGEETATSVGCEWSRAVGPAVPYARLVGTRTGGETTVEPLLGLMVPWRRVELHLELSATAFEGGAWPVRLAVGPNLPLPDGMELVPEVALEWDPAAADLGASFGVGIVVDPTSLARGTR